MRSMTEAQHAAILARKKAYYINVAKPRAEKLRLARIERKTPRLFLPAQPSKSIRLTLREIQFGPRTKPLPAHPPIRTTWLPVAAWEMAA